MKVITTNRLNRFWTNGVKPIKDALTNKVDTSKIVNSLLTTAAGYALDARQGKVLDDKITELNRKLTYGQVTLNVTNGKATFNFPKTFSSAPVAIFLSFSGTVAGSGQSYKISNITSSKCDVIVYDTMFSNPNSTYICNYLIMV